MSIASHLLVDFYGVARADDLEFLEGALLEAARAAGCGIEGVVKKKFEPQGASVVVLVSESHLSVHTWPEHDYVAIDVFTCGLALREKAVDVLKARLQPERVEVTELGRGRVLAPALAEG